MDSLRSYLSSSLPPTSLKIFLLRSPCSLSTSWSIERRNLNSSSWIDSDFFLKFCYSSKFISSRVASGECWRDPGALLITTSPATVYSLPSKELQAEWNPSPTMSWFEDPIRFLYLLATFRCLFEPWKFGGGAIRKLASCFGGVISILTPGNFSLRVCLTWLTISRFLECLIDSQS